MSELHLDRRIGEVCLGAFGTQVEQYDPYTIEYGELLPVNGFRIVR